jgi:hypothetical protein
VQQPVLRCRVAWDVVICRRERRWSRAEVEIGRVGERKDTTSSSMLSSAPIARARSQAWIATSRIRIDRSSRPVRSPVTCCAMRSNAPSSEKEATSASAVVRNDESASSPR